MAATCFNPGRQGRGLHPQARRHQDHLGLPGRITVAATIPSRSAFTASTAAGGGASVAACCAVHDGTGCGRAEWSTDDLLAWAEAQDFPEPY